MKRQKHHLGKKFIEFFVILWNPRFGREVRTVEFVRDPTLKKPKPEKSQTKRKAILFRKMINRGRHFNRKNKK